MPDYYCGFTPGSPSAQAIFNTAEGGCPGCPGVKACRDAQEVPAAEKVAPAGSVCRVCGCTKEHACETESGIPCAWLEPDLCSNCVTFSCARPSDVCPHCKVLGVHSRREPSYPSCADCGYLRWDEKRQESAQEEVAPAPQAADDAEQAQETEDDRGMDDDAFDEAAKLAIEKGWLREVPVPDPPEAAPGTPSPPPAEAQPSDPPEPDSQPAPASEKKPRQKRSKPVPAEEQPVQEIPAPAAATGDPLADARSKIQAEVGTGNHSYTRVIGNFLLQHLEASPQESSKILAKDKTIAGSLSAMRAEAQKHSTGGCAVLTDEEGFAVVLKYYGIDGAAPPRPAAPTPPKADPAPAQETKKTISFDVSLDDLL